MAIIIITFPGAPEINIEEIEKDEKFNQDLKKSINDISKEKFINYDIDFLLAKILKELNFFLRLYYKKTTYICFRSVVIYLEKKYSTTNRLKIYLAKKFSNKVNIFKDNIANLGI